MAPYIWQWDKISKMVLSTNERIQSWQCLRSRCSYHADVATAATVVAAAAISVLRASLFKPPLRPQSVEACFIDGVDEAAELRELFDLVCHTLNPTHLE